MLDRNHRMRTKIMAYHRQFLEAREERRQAEYAAIGEQIFANGCNWLRVPGQRRTDRRSSVYRVPTPHPGFRRRMGEPEHEDESCDEQEDDDSYKDDELSPLSTEQDYSPRGPVQLQRRGGRRIRHPSYRRASAVSSGSVDSEQRDELPPPYFGNGNVRQSQENDHDHSDDPTPAQEIRAIVRNVHQRRQVVVIRPSFPLPNYSAGEIVDDSRGNIRGRNTRQLIGNMPTSQTSTCTSRTATQPNAALHYLNHSQRAHGPDTNSTDANSLPSDFPYPLPPGFSDHDEEAPMFSLPSPALDMSSANLTGSLSAHPAGLSPSVLFPGAIAVEGRRMCHDGAEFAVEHIEDISREGQVQRVEDVRCAGYRHASTSTREE